MDLAFPWLSVADLELNISFSLSLTNLVALELITGLSLLSQVYSLGYMTRNGRWPASLPCLVFSRAR